MTETNVQGSVTIAGTISNFSAKLSAAPGVGNTIAFTWRDNATDQTLTCSITGASATTCADTTHSFAVAVSDLIDIKAIVTGGTVTAAVVLQWGTPGVAGPTGATGAGGGPGAAPYSTTTITASPMTITTATHGQGAKAFGKCWDASTNPQIEESCNWSRNPTSGDLTVTYSLAPAQIDIFGATGGFANPMTTAGDIIYGGTAGAATRLGIGSATTVLHGGTSAPAYSAVSLTADVTGVLPTVNMAVALANQTSINGLSITTSTGTLTVPNGVTMTGPASSGTVMALNQANTLTSAATIDASASSVTAGLKFPSAAGAAPTADGFFAFNTTNHTPAWGSNTTTMVPAIAATGTGTATTCTNQFVSAVSSLVVPTCATATLAGAQFANQGTTTTVLHGNGAGNPSFAAVGINDVSASTGTGSFVFATSPTLVTPALGTPASGVMTNMTGLALAGTPLTTRGDLLVANSTPALARLAIGAANTVLHGSSTDPAYSAVGAADFGSAITARAGLNNATAAAAAPTFSTTADFLAYQVAEIPSFAFVTSDFTTSGSGTALEAITGLTWTLPGSTALNVPFSCHIVYHQNSAAVAVAFGTQNATTAPTNYAVKGVIYTSATVFAAANVVANTATTAVSVVSGTPSAITTNWNADMDGFIEQPSGTASVFTIRVSTATAADTVTVKRGSFCRIN